MNTLVDMSSEIGVWLSDELACVSKTAESFLLSDQIEVNEVCQEVLSYQGKMVRPSLLLLSWGCVGDFRFGDTHDVRIAAAVVELIHLATLVHDDVLDEAMLRRGEKTMNCLRGNEAAVMLGDYLLSSAFHLCSTLKQPVLNMLLGKVTRTMCAGEMMQLHHRNNLSLSVDEYNKIIFGKTASLISGCCEIGAILGGANENERTPLRQFGENIGMAFQIRDDLLDLLGEQSFIGKPAGRDLEKGKLTLPIILLLQRNPGLASVVGLAIENKDHVSLKSLVDRTMVVQETWGEIDRLVDVGVNQMQAKYSNHASEQLCLLASQLKNSFKLG